MKKIVVIGGGPAGLSFAYSLLKRSKDYSVTILESDSCVGGISKTVNHNGNRIDIGGHRFFTKNEEVKKLWFELLPIQCKSKIDLYDSDKFNINGPDPEIEDLVMLVRHRVSRIYYNKTFFDYPVSLTLKTLKGMGVGTSIECGFSYIKASLFKLEEVNLENFYINNFGYKLYSMFFRDYTTKVWGRSPKEIDASWGSQRAKGISISGVILDYFKRVFKINGNKAKSLIEEFYYPKFGPGELYEEMAQRIEKMKGKILLNSEVIKIEKKNNKIESVTYISDGKEKKIKCDYVISSMPIKDLINSFDAVPKKVNKISDDLPYRDFVTIGVLVDKINLVNNTKYKTIHGFVPDNWIYIQTGEVLMGRIQIFNNWSPYMVKDNKKIWMGLEYFCNEGDSFWNSSDEELVKLATKELKIIGITDSPIIDSVVIRVKKAYPAYFDSYKDIYVVRKYINKISNLYCIGRNGTHSYNNMDHSILSGIVCSDMILNNNHDLDKLWNINVDKEYQEEA